MKPFWYLALVLMTIPFACTRTLGVAPTSPSAPPPAPVCPVDSTLNLVGNLNTGLQLNQTGGILQVYNTTTYQWVLPFESTLTSFTSTIEPTTKLSFNAAPAFEGIFSQYSNLTVPLDTAPTALPNHTTVVAVGQPSPLVFNSGSPTALGYAWDQPSTYPAACTVVKTFTDGPGFTHQVTFLFYQVNDLGVMNINSPPNNQAVYAWFAFDTSLGSPINDWTLIGGTYILETSPYSIPGSYACDDRGVAGDIYWGDFLYFNSDGSLASEGAVRSSGGPQVQAKPRLLETGLVTTGAPDTSPLIGVNFGTAGILGHGLRDGVTGDMAAFTIH